MASEILADMKEEVTCPICLDLLIEPMSTDCGHSFCQACITSNCESTKNQEGKGMCPVCRASFQFENLRPNRLVASLVERLRGVTLNPRQEKQKECHCTRHGEKLQLFCKEDGMVICWLCERSKEHRNHKTFLLEEVAQEYQEKLQKVLQNMNADIKDIESWEDVILKERTYWKNQIKEEQQNVQEIFKQLREDLNSEEKKELQKLKKEEEHILNSLEDSEHELAKQKLLVGDLISDLKKRMAGSTMDMLQNVNIIIERSETLPLKIPKTFPMKQRRVFQGFDLRAALQGFQALTEARHYWVQVTLVPIKNPNITITDDQRKIKYKLHKSNVPVSSNGVLGSPVITSGKHYWEVDVSKKRDWILGINDGRCQKPVVIPPLCPRLPIRAAPFSFSNASVSESYQHANYCPPSAYWVIGVKDDHTFLAYKGDPFSPDCEVLTLCVSVSPHCIGVFLDYKAGTLSFYNVTNNGALIYRFSNCSFPREVFPYFNPMLCSQPMTVCWPNS